MYLQVTSIESVQRALYESGNVSLGEALANNLAERLHLPRRHATAAEAAEAALAPSAPPPEEQCTETFELVLQAQLPPWFTPYPFVLTSYRSGFSYRLCLASLFRLHNETLNVWSELAPAVCFAVWMARHICIRVCICICICMHICSLDPNPTRTLDQRPSPLTFHPTHLPHPNPAPNSSPQPKQARFLEQHRDADTEDLCLVSTGLAVSCVLRPLCSGLAHLFHVTSASGYILWWSVDYVSICLAILATSLVSGRFAFYCLEPLQILFFTSIGGLLSSSMVAVLAVSSPVLRSASFALFVLFSNGVPFLYTLGIKLSPSSRYHAGADVPWRYINLWVRAPRPMPHAPCPMPHAPCPMPHA